ncbi:DUF2584 domain-containing protein [Peribacillus muralis]|uniref:DUF2584 domain-containing protein n=1 Tax=Peribacillus muralis TaxID=264697 RepID=UPI00070EFF31|nr:DUF2584 domain-containing protein [Peribacillus muralis]MCK1994865.1 DUF2584 domain-containing protein [Peribacillus muralis]MCK2015308.1 DUF2584 domain-containing protein [Peribacillus muralis]
MGMPIELNTMIVTKGNETREQENIFRLAKDGYRLYPIDIPIDVRKTIQSDTSGTAVIQKVEWTSEKTIITYELLSLNSTN